MKIFKIAAAVLCFTAIGNAQTVSRTVAWKYDFAHNPSVTGFELIYYSNGVTNAFQLPLVTQYAVTLTMGQRYDFELRASSQGIKSTPATAWHVPLPASPVFIQTNILLTITNAMNWQQSHDLIAWISAPITESRMNIMLDAPQFFRLAGGGAATNVILSYLTL